MSPQRSPADRQERGLKLMRPVHQPLSSTVEAAKQKVQVPHLVMALFPTSQCLYAACSCAMERSQALRTSSAGDQAVGSLLPASQCFKSSMLPQFYINSSVAKLLSNHAALPRQENAIQGSQCDKTSQLGPVTPRTATYQVLRVPSTMIAEDVMQFEVLLPGPRLFLGTLLGSRLLWMEAV